LARLDRLPEALAACTELENAAPKSAATHATIAIVYVYVFNKERKKRKLEIAQKAVRRARTLDDTAVAPIVAQCRINTARANAKPTEKEIHLRASLDLANAVVPNSGDRALFWELLVTDYKLNGIPSALKMTEDRLLRFPRDAECLTTQAWLFWIKPHKRPTRSAKLAL
jgi:hypothetical protein